MGKTKLETSTQRADLGEVMVASLQGEIGDRESTSMFSFWGLEPCDRALTHGVLGITVLEELAEALFGTA
jgi:hypothetical protein